MSQFALPLSTLQTMQVVIRPDRFLDLGCDFEPNPEAPLVMQAPSLHSSDHAIYFKTERDHQGALLRVYISSTVNERPRFQQQLRDGVYPTRGLVNQPFRPPPSMPCYLPEVVDRGSFPCHVFESCGPPAPLHPSVPGCSTLLHDLSSLHHALDAEEPLANELILSLHGDGLGDHDAFDFGSATTAVSMGTGPEAFAPFDLGLSHSGEPLSSRLRASPESFSSYSPQSQSPQSSDSSADSQWPTSETTACTTRFCNIVPEMLAYVSPEPSDYGEEDSAPGSPGRQGAKRRRYSCGITGCTRRFTSRYTLKIHQEAHRPKEKTLHRCTAGCMELFSRQHDRLRHEVAKHGKVCEWVCGSCQRFFSSSRTLERHKCPVSAGIGLPQSGLSSMVDS